MTRASGPRAARLVRAAALALAVLAGDVASARAQVAAGAAEHEGPLGNASVLPVHAGAHELALAGDRAFARARRETDRAAAERALTEAFDGWRSALAASRPGDAVPFALAPHETPEDPLALAAHDVRRVEGVEAAIRRRLAALSDGERAAWRARHAPAANARLDALLALAARADDGSRARAASEGLAALEREFPATSAAARAALVLGDVAHAAARSLAARTWHARASEHVVLLDPSERAAITAALARRAPPSPAMREPEPWERAASYELAAVHPLADPFFPSAFVGSGQFARGVRPGLAWLADGRAAVQSASRVFVLSADGARIDLVLEPADLLADELGEPALPYPPPGQPGWLLAPAARGLALVVVEGRAPPRGDGGNALLCIDLPAPLSGTPAPHVLAGELPELRWARRGEQRTARRAAENAAEPAAALDGVAAASDASAHLADLELQPGPAWLGERVVAQGRRGSGDLEGWALAFGADDGRVAWSSLVVRGAERGPGGGRFSLAGLVHGAAAEIVEARHGRAVLVATHLGSASLVDALDGRLAWSVLNQRAPGSDPLWSGAAPVAFDGGFLWAPVDSDHLYALPDEPFGDGPLEGPGGWRAPPLARGEAIELAGGDSERALVLARAGARIALRGVEFADGASIDAVHFAPGEEAREGAHVGVARVAVASDRALWVFERSDDLYLAEQVPLPSGPLAAPDAAPGARGPAPRRVGGSVHARGALVVVVELDRVLVFRARP